MGIRLAVATERTQGQRSNDFSWTVEGEPVYAGFVCSADQKDPDGGCGCGRAFSGLTSRKGTTTAIIRELEITPEDLTATVRASYIAGGWIRDNEPDKLGLVDDTVRAMRELGESFEIGTVIERRLDDYSARGPAPRKRHLHSVPRPKQPWAADGPVMPESGVVGGDGAGQSFSIRYRRPDIPGAMITSYWYPVDESERYTDDPDDPNARTGWDVENQVEFVICTDPADPGSTEEWSEYQYRNPTEMVFKTEAEAIAYAERSAKSESAKHYDWNGEPWPQ